MSIGSNARRLTVVPDTEESKAPQPPASHTTTEPVACSSCSGAGPEVVPGEGARRCRCRAEGAQEELSEAARVPRRYGGCSLSNYQPAANNGSRPRAFNYAYSLARGYPAVERGPLFTGPCGVGKTHLSVAVLRELMEKRGVPWLFQESGPPLKGMQNSYSRAWQGSGLKVLAPVVEAGALVLDELGAVKPRGRAGDTMMQIMGARYNAGRLTVLTTG